jgi:hypothetical protein
MLLANVIEHGRYLFGLGDVSDKIVAADFSGDSLRVVLVTRMDDNPCSFTGERAGNGQANIMSRSGNKRNFLFQKHEVSPLAK